MKKINKIGKNLAVFTVIGGVLISSFPINTYALTKNETVYSKLDYNGATRSIIVNEQLINSKKANKIEDYSELKNILNLNNDSEYEINNGKITWNANGNDIFYQGTTDKELPISTTITYKLNGEIKDLKDILGKKGNITINIKYVNHDKHGSLYTPFVITMGTIIDSKNNSSISVTNGKVVDNGSKNIIIGLAAPGLYESFNLKELKGLDTITISYYTEKFELASIYSVVTPKLIESSDLKVFDKLDTLSSSVNQLQSNMNSIEQGAKDVSKGSSDLKNGLQNSIENLNKTNKDNALTDSQVEGIKNQTVSSIKGIYTDTYKEEIANSAYQKVLESMASSSDQTVTNYVKSSISISFTNYLKNINEYDDYVHCETGKAIVKNGGEMSEAQTNSCVIIQNDKTLPYVMKALTDSTSEVASKTSSYIAENVSKSVASSVSYETALQVATNVSETVANSVANEVKNKSIESISGSLKELMTGVSKLDDGINELSSGISKFNAEGINKLSQMMNSNVKNVTTKVKNLTKLGEEYASFAGKTNNTDGETKFVLVIDSKKVEESVKDNSNTKTKTTFWDRVKNLFK